MFAKNDNDGFGYAVVKHDIFATDETNEILVSHAHRRIPPNQYQEVKEHIEKLLDNGIIRESHSSYTRPMVLVRKKTVKGAYPLPRIDKSLDALSVHFLFQLLT